MPASSDRTHVVEGLLGSDVAKILASVEPTAQLRLVGQVEAAQSRQAQLIEDAVQTAVRGVPLPVRGIVKKALLG
jgi:hypothetical protein